MIRKLIARWTRGRELPRDENLVAIHGGFYIVRTQAGFRRLVKDLEVYDPRNWPQTYPCLVSDAGRGYFHIVRLNTLLELLSKEYQ